MGTELPPQRYRDERPAESMAPFHAWARTQEPGWTYTAVRVLLTPVVLVLYRCRCARIEVTVARVCGNKVLHSHGG